RGRHLASRIALMCSILYCTKVDQKSSPRSNWAVWEYTRKSCARVVPRPLGDDATEKIASLLRSMVPDLRVIVPCRAKSNGTMLALVGCEIVMGTCSELGPADPFITINPTNVMPAQFLINAPNVDPILVQIATHAIKQTAALAKALLSSGMLKGRDPNSIDAVVQALSSRQTYPSHGSVIDADEAARLGLTVTKLSPDDELWQRLWLLRCMYDHDLAKMGGLKIFEGPTVSNALKAAVAKS